MVQYIVELNNQHVINALVRQLIGNYAHLARNKYGSHVVQKLLRLRGVDTRLIVVDLLSQIDTLLLDPFGNYVIQTAWFVSKVRPYICLIAVMGLEILCEILRILFGVFCRTMCATC